VDDQARTLRQLALRHSGGTACPPREQVGNEPESCTWQAAGGDPAARRRYVADVPVAALAGRRSSLVVVTGARGGVGTTTIAAGLAVWLSGQGRGTALVDADPHGDLALRFGLDQSSTVGDVLTGRRTAGQALRCGPAQLWLLPAAWDQSEVLQATPDAQQWFIRQLRSLGDGVPSIIVDTGTGQTELARRLWRAADAVLVVTTPQGAAVAAAYGTIKRLAAGGGQIPIWPIVTGSSPEETKDVAARLAHACRRFLGINLCRSSG
jgi:MinD-like ATPase involved in chromosome partitioning or flagellar assembly